jgi:hypothetical protein
MDVDVVLVAEDVVVAAVDEVVEETVSVNEPGQMYRQAEDADVSEPVDEPKNTMLVSVL